MASQVDVDARLLAVYEAVGVAAGRVVHLVVGPGLDAEAQLAAVQQLVGAAGTIVVRAATPSLLDSQAPFDPASTPAEDPLAEALRRRPGSRRGMHPFESYVALGAEADALVTGTGPHELGPETPPGRLVAKDALAVTAGLPPHAARAAGRLAEFAMAVPYRYVREVPHPIKRDGAMVMGTFYLHLPYRGIGLQLDDGAALFGRARASGLDLRTAVAGGITIAAWSMAAFYRLACAALRRDLYIGCITPPAVRPYRQ